MPDDVERLARLLCDSLDPDDDVYGKRRFEWLRPTARELLADRSLARPKALRALAAFDREAADAS